MRSEEVSVQRPIDRVDTWISKQDAVLNNEPMLFYAVHVK